MIWRLVLKHNIIDIGAIEVYIQVCQVAPNSNICCSIDRLYYFLPDQKLVLKLNEKILFLIRTCKQNKTPGPHAYVRHAVLIIEVVIGPAGSRVMG